MVVILYITSVIVVCYAVVIFMLRRGFLKGKRARGIQPGSGKISTDDQLRVSVIVPFRNEYPHLEGLVNDLENQNYPPEQFEVIFVNDHSDDDSGQLLESLIGINPRFHGVELPDGLTGKKEALAMGINRANHPWIIQTDADCRLGEDFISGHISYLQGSPSDFVAGMVTTDIQKADLISTLELLDLLSLVGSGAGSFHYGKPMLCNGANLLYSKSLFLETRPFDPSDRIRSGDDMFLMIGARKLKKRLSFNASTAILVRTRPTRTLGALIRQRIRWGSKALHYGMSDIQLLALLVAVTNLSILISPLWLVLSPYMWPWITGAWLVKGTADLSMLFAVTAHTGQRRVLRWFIPVYLVYYPLQFVILSGSLWMKTSWKGRRLVIHPNNETHETASSR
jgi:cellulose synthase/poly-beta-1,6-N-acetylglucosamine synthase-like glycosyltransferase